MNAQGEGMDEGKLFSVQTAFSVITSLSVLSVTIVIPYTIGYFTFYNLNYMSAFALSDFYIFVAMPLIVGILVFSCYTMQSLVLIGRMGEVISVIMSRF